MSRRSRYVPPPPVCFICRDCIGSNEPVDKIITSSKIFDECAGWKERKRKHGCLMAPVSDLDNVYFRVPWPWNRLYRAIVRVIDGNEVSFYLKGVGFYRSQYHGYSLNPRDRNKVFIGDMTYYDGRIWMSNMLRATCDHGFEFISDVSYPMHERCWSLVTRMLDVKLIEENLGLFVMAMRRHAQQITRKEYNDLWTMHIDETSYKTRYGSLKKHEWRIPEHYLDWSRDKLECSNKKYVLRDPWKIVDIRDFLNAEREKFNPKRDLRSKALSRRMGIDSTVSPSNRKQKSSEKPAQASRHSMRLRSVRNSRVLEHPPEIVMMIVELIFCRSDIRSIMRAFPHWMSMFPQSYWRSLCVKELMLEDEELPGVHELDWLDAYGGIDRLVSGSHGLHNRQRIVKLIKNIEEIFLLSLQDA